MWFTSVFPKESEPNVFVPINYSFCKYLLREYCVSGTAWFPGHTVLKEILVFPHGICYQDNLLTDLEVPFFKYWVLSYLSHIILFPDCCLFHLLVSVGAIIRKPQARSREKNRVQSDITLQSSNETLRRINPSIII